MYKAQYLSTLNASFHWNLQNNPTRQRWSTFYRWKNWGTEKLSNLVKFNLGFFLWKPVLLIYLPVNHSLRGCAQWLSCCLVSKSYPTLATPWTVALQTLLSMEFSRQAYCSGLPFPIPDDLPYPGRELMSLMSPVLARGFFITEPPWIFYLFEKTNKWAVLYYYYKVDI